jgi:hypothetical protein
MLGAVGDSRGMGRPLKSNTSKIHTDSSFREGCVLYELFNYARAQGLSQIPLRLRGVVPRKASRIRLRLREIDDEGKRNHTYFG